MRRVLALGAVAVVLGASLGPVAGGAETGPVNGLVAFGAGPPAGLWLADVDVPAYEKLKDSGAVFAFAQDWSPDGNEVLYTQGKNGVNSLRIVGVDGSNDRQIVPAGNVGDASWAPDGETIMYATWTNGVGSTLMLIDPDGYDVRDVGGLPNGLGFRLSPDGTMVAFEGVNYCWDLMVADIDLSDPTPTATNVRAVFETQAGDPDCNASISGISWTPDSSALVFADMVDNGDQPPWWDCGWNTIQREIFSINVDGTDLTQLTSTGGIGWQNEFHPEVSPDGTKIAFASDAPTQCVDGSWDYEFSGNELFVMNLDGSAVEGPLTDFGLAYQTVGISSGAGPKWQTCTPTTSICSLPSFSDVPASHPFFAEIEWMADTGVSTGYNDGTFRPAADVTRQAMSAFMYRLAGEPVFSPPGTPSFSDVPASHPFFAEIEWMADTGISTGYNDGTFRPGADVTRQAMSAFMYRLAGEPVFASPGSPTFSDVPASHPFFAEIEWMADTGVSTGYNDGTFRPAADVTRQAMSAFMYRLDPLLG